jgi:hypothetical protein
LAKSGSALRTESPVTPVERTISSIFRQSGLSLRPQDAFGPADILLINAGLGRGRYYRVDSRSVRLPFQFPAGEPYPVERFDRLKGRHVVAISGEAIQDRENRPFSR